MFLRRSVNGLALRGRVVDLSFPDSSSKFEDFAGSSTVRRQGSSWADGTRLEGVVQKVMFASGKFVILEDGTHEEITIDHGEHETFGGRLRVLPREGTTGAPPSTARSWSWRA